MPFIEKFTFIMWNLTVVVSFEMFATHLSDRADMTCSLLLRVKTETPRIPTNNIITEIFLRRKYDHFPSFCCFNICV